MTKETICGAEMPDRLWLHDMGSGDIEWSCEAVPDGETPLESVEYVRAATLPQQAATDEGEAYRRGIYDAKVWLRDQQHKNPPDSLWHAAAILADRMDVALLSTPTSQPPAAETRLREALERLVLWADQMTGRVEPEYGCIAYARGALAEYDAALTQPEPTAQQGGGGQ